MLVQAEQRLRDRLAVPCLILLMSLTDSAADVTMGSTIPKAPHHFLASRIVTSPSHVTHFNLLITPCTILSNLSHSDRL